MGTEVAVMKKGDLQQVAPPDELFAKPTNLFVAGFIGSPAMNFVQARLSRDNGAYFVSFGDARLEVDEEAVTERPALAGYDGRSLVLGIRPDATEDAAIARDAPESRRFTARAELRETVGSEAFVHFTLAAEPVVTEDTRELASDTGAEMLKRLEEEASEHKTPFVARMHARSRAREGERVEVAVDTRELHFFDLETGAGIYA
jgi:multiple sugar transport system ATP-binding protein